MPYPGFDKSKRNTQSEPLAPPPREVVDTVGKTETFWSRNVKLVTFICCMAVIIAGMVAFGVFLHGETKQPDNLMTEEQMQALVEKGSLLTVKDFEPYLALCGGEDGYDFYTTIIRYWKEALVIGGRLYFEVGIGQADTVLRMMRAEGFGDLQIVPDLQGIPRVVYGTRLDAIE